MSAVEGPKPNDSRPPAGRDVAGASYFHLSNRWGVGGDAAKIVSFFCASLALALLRPATAQEAPPRLTVIGAGAGVSCAEWVAANGLDPDMEQWAFGFASAVAAGSQLQRGGDPLAGMDANAIHAWLGEHCRRRPEEALSVALVRMVVTAAR